jgi:histidinol-phosphate aminotransferase
VTDEALVAEHIEGLVPYEPGMPIEELERQLGIRGAIKLASNENPLGPSPRALEAARAALAEAHRYPDGGGFRLRHAIAEHIGVAPASLILGAGSNEIIDLVVRVFCRPGVDEVVTHRYAFMAYGISCQAHGVTMREAEVGADLACDVDALAAAITPRTKLVFLPNPNNPTGAYVRRGALERLIERLPPRVLLVVDEAYVEYASGRPEYVIAEPYRRQHPLLLSLRTFSKVYGLAGLRVGYGIADPKVVGYLNRVRMPFNVSAPAQEAARAAIDDIAHVERARIANAEGIAQLSAGLARLPVTLLPTAANFVLVDLGREALPIHERLLRKGVIVRPLRPLGLTRHLRVTVGARAENERFLSALAEALSS